MKHKSETRSTSPDTTIDENSPKKSKNKRKSSDKLIDEFADESKEIENISNVNKKKYKKSKKRTDDPEEENTAVINEQVSIDFNETEDISGSVKRKKKKKKSKNETEKPEINEEESIQNLPENGIEKKVKKSKKEKNKTKVENSEENEKLIENIQNEEMESDGNVKKTKKQKRKNKDEDEIQSDSKVKKPKKKKLNTEEEKIADESKDEVNGTDDADVKKKKGPSKRQLKKDKQELREKEKSEAAKLKNSVNVLNYISKWKHARSEWKFETIKQAFLVNHFLDDKLIPDKFYPIVIEYFEGCKGKAKSLLLKKAMAVIKEVEEKFEESEDAVESTEYQRARQLLQNIPTDT